LTHRFSLGDAVRRAAGRNLTLPPRNLYAEGVRPSWAAALCELWDALRPRTAALRRYCQVVPFAAHCFRLSLISGDPELPHVRRRHAPCDSVSKIHFLALCWGLLVLVWIISAFSAKPSRERQSRSSRLATLGYLILTFLLLAGRLGLNARVLPNAPVLRLMGDVITFVGLVIALWARFALGANWSGTITFKEGHELIERGPYRFVRHPMYTGLLLMILGTAVALGSLSGLLALLLGFTGMWRKLKREEALLTKHFPDAYPRYMSRTKALVPFLL
jgi:protein-S-isoprenylcysteine O-methyltransferase Ste14